MVIRNINGRAPLGIGMMGACIVTNPEWWWWMLSVVVFAAGFIGAEIEREE
ncbi:hypothetical protein [Achromobacter xylosoxidans]|uniref:hypothetical protein n=1 Tax=Alcaligenes xylosoxydans xylosoxydans TaxID=85698 RepID=UPI0015C66DC5|nr:hypothetical protein [Achromobacter xylosoxidans]